MGVDYFKCVPKLVVVGLVVNYVGEGVLVFSLYFSD